MLVEISDTIVEAVEKYAKEFESEPHEIKYNVNTMLREYLTNHVPYDGYSELYDLDIERDVI